MEDNGLQKCEYTHIGIIHCNEEGKIEHIFCFLDIENFSMNLYIVEHLFNVLHIS